MIRIIIFLFNNSQKDSSFQLCTKIIILYCPQNSSMVTDWCFNDYTCHLGEKPFLCDQCSYTTNRASNLKLHMRKHVADRSEISEGDIIEYKCTECEQIFRLKTELKEHLRLHDSRRMSSNVKRRSTRQKGVFNSHLMIA